MISQSRPSSWFHRYLECYRLLETDFGLSSLIFIHENVILISSLGATITRHVSKNRNDHVLWDVAEVTDIFTSCGGGKPKWPWSRRSCTWPEHSVLGIPCWCEVFQPRIKRSSLPLKFLVSKAGRDYAYCGTHMLAIEVFNTAWPVLSLLRKPMRNFMPRSALTASIKFYFCFWRRQGGLKDIAEGVWGWMIEHVERCYGSLLSPRWWRRVLSTLIA